MYYFRLNTFRSCNNSKEVENHLIKKKYLLLLIKKFESTENLLLQTFLVVCKIFHFNGVLPHLYWKESFRVSALQKKRLSHFLSSAKGVTCNQQFRKSVSV